MDLQAKTNIPNSKPTISPAWAQFAQRLASVLQGLQEDQFLVISAKQSAPYVQFVGQGFYGIRMETISNQYLDRPEKLTEHQLHMLAELGWNHPTKNIEDKSQDKDPEGSPNFYIDHSTPVSFDTAAEVAVTTLAAVHKIPHPGYLQYEAFDSDGNSISISALGLKRMTRSDESNPQKIRQDLLSIIKKITGLTDLQYNQDGNIGIRSGSLLALIRYEEHPPSIRFHSPLVSGIEESPELHVRLNELNSGVGCMHFFYHNNRVIAVSDIPAAPFHAGHFLQTFKMFYEIADGVDELLAGEFGGKTAFAHTMPTTTKQ
jgi:hypothetical protein